MPPKIFILLKIIDLVAGAAPRGAIEAISPLKPKNITFINHDFCNLQTAFHDVTPFCYCFVTAVL